MMDGLHPRTRNRHCIEGITGMDHLAGSTVRNPFSWHGNVGTISGWSIARNSLRISHA